MGNYFHLRTKRYYHKWLTIIKLNDAKYGVFLKNCADWGRCYLGKQPPWPEQMFFFSLQILFKIKCHLSSKICCVFLHMFRWVLVIRLFGLQIVVNSFAIFFCSLMPKQRARLHCGAAWQPRGWDWIVHWGNRILLANSKYGLRQRLVREELTGKANQKRRNILK